MKTCRKDIWLLLCLLLCVGFAAAAPAEINNEELTDFTEHGMQLWHVPGMSVAVVTENETLFQKGFGKTSIEGGRPVDEHTQFAIASTTKAMVAAGILILADEGSLSLDDAITDLVPELHFHESIKIGRAHV